MLLVCVPNFSWVHFEDSNLSKVSAKPANWGETAPKTATDSDILGAQAEGKENGKCSVTS